MITNVKLFVSRKGQAVPRPLGLRRLRRAPSRGQTFAIHVDGHSVRARITRVSVVTKRVQTILLPNVYAEEI